MNRDLKGVIKYADEVKTKYNLKIKIGEITLNTKFSSCWGKYHKAGEKIQISAKHLEKSPIESVMNTVRHELAHMCAWQIDKKGGHRKEFRKWAKLMEVTETNFKYNRKRIKVMAVCPKCNDSEDTYGYSNWRKVVTRTTSQTKELRCRTCKALLTDKKVIDATTFQKDRNKAWRRDYMRAYVEARRNK